MGFMQQNNEKNVYYCFIFLHTLHMFTSEQTLLHMLNQARITSEQTLLHMLVIWSERADTHFMDEIYAYGARQHPSNT